MAGDALRVVVDMAGIGIAAVGIYRLHQRKGNVMTARSFATTDTGVQAAREVNHTRLRADGLDLRYRLDVIAPSAIEVVTHAGGWLFDRVMAGWDVTIFIADHSDVRPLQILGTQTLSFDRAFVSRDDRPRPQALAVATDVFGSDLRVRRRVLKALARELIEVTLWGEARLAELDRTTDSVQHQLSAAARVFKAQALAAAAAPNASIGMTETFRSRLSGCALVADLVPASCHLS